MSRPAFADRSQFLRRTALAAICLVLVAGLHAYRVWAVRQTPWKGGGFGMFSTIDAESARFLRVTLTLDGAAFPVRVPESLAKRAAELRAAPTEAAAFALVDKLRQLRWRRRGEYWKSVAEKVTARAAITGEALRPPLGSAEDLARGQGSDWEPVGAQEKGIAATAARIEVLRERFDPATATLHAEPIFVISRAGAP